MISKSVLIFCGSARLSFTRALCTRIGDELISLGVSVETVDPRVSLLPFAETRSKKASGEPVDVEVERLSRAAHQASAFVFATPIYHNGPSGILKNMLDLLQATHFMHKPVGLVSHGGNRTTQAVEQMRIWARGMGAHAIITQICTAPDDYDQAADNPNIANPAMVSRIVRFARELLLLTDAMGSVHEKLRLL
ncbi:NADPH-dependent FMN reductase [Agrobacterium tumefaciens]|uniref:NADPH-dependent FMN reductase n=1 Tax=Agrobacterium tumefaciens TaxID=358 RepID=UPI00047218E7